MFKDSMDVSVWTKDRMLFLDGGMGTQLQAKGLQPGEIPELWNVTRPQDVRAVHEAYFAAGADVVRQHVRRQRREVPR